MSEKLVNVLAPLLNMEAEQVKTKIASDEGLTEIETKLKGMKVFESNQKYLETLNAYGASQKDIHYKELKKEVHFAIEKDFKQKNPELAALEYGKDYKDTYDLFSKAIELKAPKDNGKKEDWEKEKSQFEGKIQELNKKLETIPGETAKQYEKRIHALVMQSAYSGLIPRIAVDASKNAEEQAAEVKEKIEFLQWKFEKEGLEIIEKDGQFFVGKDGVIDKDNDTFKPITVEQKINQLADKNSLIKKDVSAGGRGEKGKTGQEAQGALDWGMFPTFDKYLETESGKKLIPGSQEMNEKYAAWYKAHGK
jgi:hypothetical protein